LQIIENQLRLAGQHVILDAGESVLWLFDLIEANRTATSGNPTKEVTSRMIDEYNLIGRYNSEALKISSNLSFEEVGSGLLQPSELRSNLRSDISAPKSMITSNRLVHPSIDSYPMHGNAFGEYTALGKKALFSPLDVPMTNPVQASQQFNSISLIYLRFLEAVSRSILFQAGVSGKWLPIGSHSFIGPIPSAKSESQARGFGIQEAVHGLTLFLLHIELLPSGSLIVAGTPTLGSQLRRIYNEVETGSGSIGVIVGSDIILVPSGDIYTYDGEADLQSSIRISTQPAQQYPALVSGAIYEADMRASIIHHLIQQGIDVPQGDKWIRLRAKGSRSVFAHGDGARSHFKPESERVLWPASLCFVTSNKAPVEDYDTTCIGKLAKEMSLDPLAHAEAWYRAKYAREESTKAALEKKIKDSELEARLAYEARSPDVQDTHSDSDTRVTQYLSTQEASRIYPTPPDGLRAEVVGPLGTHEPQTTSGGPDDNDGLHSGNDGSALGETQFPASPGFVASSTRYNQATDDDLFGDLETGLFATSGLTEADFSFFDEPSEDDGNEPGTVSPSVRSKPILGINEETASQAAASSCLKTTEAAAENLPDKRKQDRETVAVSSTSGHDRQGILWFP